MVRLRIAYPDAQPDEICGETLWATPLKNGNYRLENHPVWEEYQYGDVVKAAVVADGMLQLQSLVMRSLQ